jgi:RES domain-containing protein
MTTLWRISRYADLAGEGGRKGSGRWHTRGKPIVYLAETPAGAMLETIVHLMDLDREEHGNLPSTYDLIKVEAPDGISAKPLNALAAVGWQDRIEVSQKIGDAWLALMETALARVPSAIMPYTWNYLLNPGHPDAKQVAIAEVIKERFDNRLFRFGAG